MQTDGRTDTTKLIVAFRNFANVLTNAILGTDSNQILRTAGKHWPNNTVSDLSSLECSAMSLAQPHTLQSVIDPVNMGSAHTFHIIRKVLRPATSTHVFLGFHVPKGKC